MLSPPPHLKFLLDENVKRRLLAFIKSKGFDASIAPKGVANGKLAAFCKLEKRVLITNDSDFANPILFPKGKVFSIVLLKIPQDMPEALLDIFGKLLKGKTNARDFEGKLITLKEKEIEVSEIVE